MAAHHWWVRIPQLSLLHTLNGRPSTIHAVSHRNLFPMAV
jgi:hypothetical protein